MKHEQSQLRAIVNEVFEASNLAEGKQIILNFLEDKACTIPVNTRHILKVKAQRQVSLTDLQYYVTNSLLRYEGMSTS